MSKKLKINNCPLCKSEVELVHEDFHDEYHLACDGCNLIYGLGDDGEIFRGYDHKEKLIEEWNDKTELEKEV